MNATLQRPPVTVPCASTAFGCPRDFLGNRFVYTVISPRARGLSIGVNLNPDKFCNFDCVYCEVDRREPARVSKLDVDVMISELEQTLQEARDGRLRERSYYRTLPAELLQLRHVALSGDGEPTQCPNFAAAVEAVIHLRARGRFPSFKLVLITNASGLNRAGVTEGLRFRARQQAQVLSPGNHGEHPPARSTKTGHHPEPVSVH
jgi:wyosine [tRNA(Phe)-imidazoG37] synthetase (radical SAM superfamily)